MSCIGIDFGNDNCIVAQAKRGGIDVVLNENSNRKNPTLVSFQGKQRFVGEQAATLTRSNIRNTVVGIKKLIGRQFAEAEVQNTVAKLGYTVEESAGGKIAIKVNYDDREISLSTEQAASMMFGKLKTIAEAANNGVKVADTCVSVPGFFNDSQRRAVYNACKIAGLNVLRVMNEHTAVALAYGIWKSARNMFHETEPQKVMFVDMGHSSFTVSIAFFVQGKLQMKSACYDRTLGGSAFDEVIMQECINVFREKHGRDVSQDKKALVKLQAAAEKAKKTLSPQGVTEAQVTVECLADEIDLNYKLTLERFNELCEPLLRRMEAPLRAAMAEAGIAATADLACVEIVGGATRVMNVKNRLCEYLGLDPSNSNSLMSTLNADESVARGAALQCAILSPLFKVKPFAVEDIVTYPVRLCWEAAAGEASKMEQEGGEGEGEALDNAVVIFRRNDESPKVRRVTFRRSSTFEVTAVYDESCAALLPEGAPAHIGRWEISGLVPAEGGATPRVRVDVKHDLHGCFTVLYAQQLTEIKEEEEKAAGEGEGKAEGEEKAAGEEKKGEEKKEGETKKKRYRKTDLRIEAITNAMSAAQIQAALDLESAMAQADRLIQETSDQRNELEAYIYDARDKATADGELGPFFTPEAVEQVAAALQDAEDWLYSEEGFESSKAVYADRLAGLRNMVVPAERRKTEQEGRAAAVSELRAAADMYKSLAQSLEERYDHIGDDERNTIKNECAAAEAWLFEQLERQGALPQTADPVLTLDQIRARKQTLANVCRPIMNKPRPKPKVEEPPPAPAAAAGGETKMETEGEAEGEAKVEMEMEGEGKAAAEGDDEKVAMELD